MHQFWRETAEHANMMRENSAEYGSGSGRSSMGPSSGVMHQSYMGKANITVNPGGGDEDVNWGRKALHLQQESIL